MAQDKDASAKSEKDNSEEKSPEKTNGKSNGAETQPSTDNATPQLDPAMAKRISEVRTRVHETFGKVSLAMMALPRYRHLSLLDLNNVLLEPLIRDRVAIASSKQEDEGNPAMDMAGIAIWASVSQEVDGRIREQIQAGVFPVRLSSEDWTSGNINWLFDVIAPNAQLTASVIANFRQVVKEGDLRIHPLITRLVDGETLKKMGAAPIDGDTGDKKE